MIIDRDRKPDCTNALRVLRPLAVLVVVFIVLAVLADATRARRRQAPAPAPDLPRTAAVRPAPLPPPATPAGRTETPGPARQPPPRPKGLAPEELQGLPGHIRQQTQDLRAQARETERLDDPLSLSEEEIRALRQSGSLIY
ncbi:MAG: hypothetical protein JXR37_34215 [Kiritimatiellae bacterium]|nr:hypothetical protein [Kiritimatiellia bacterium]